MKRILVISDTHGDLALAQEVIRVSVPLDGVIHLGDLVQDARSLERTCGLTFWKVAGNNDRYEDAPRELLIRLEDVSIYSCHGDLYDFHPHHPARERKRSMRILVDRANRQGAQCALFAHTHQAFCERQGALLVMNPGTLSPAEKDPGYGLLTIEAGRVRGAVHRAGGRRTVGTLIRGVLRRFRREAAAAPGRKGAS